MMPEPIVPLPYGSAAYWAGYIGRPDKYRILVVGPCHGMYSHITPGGEVKHFLASELCNLTLIPRPR